MQRSLHEREQQFEGSAIYYRKKLQIQAPQNNYGQNISMTSSLTIRNDIRVKQPQSKKKILSILEGKTTIVWIFVIASYISEQHQKRITTMYNGFGNIIRQYIVPLYDKCSHIEGFLELPSTRLKIVSDLRNIKDVIEFSKNKKISQVYIYNERGEEGFFLALEQKQKCSKIRGIFTNLEEILQRAEDDVDNDLKFFEASNNEIKSRKRVKIFPNFILLSGSDKTKATLYRANLYGARNLSDSERYSKLQSFLALIEQKYKNQPSQHGNIASYVTLNKSHSQPVTTLSQAQEILSFYTRQSFYYKILNSMLRTLKSPKQFNPCILPFNETYHSVKLFYKNYLLKNKRKISPMTLYRGARLSQGQLNKLRPGVYIQMYGFMSTSTDKNIALNFTNSTGIIFKINVPELIIHQKYDKYDHGFVDINGNEIGSFSHEKQILFNALNIYKVISKKPQNGFTFIELQYGSIFKLIQKKSSLSSQEREVFTNYQYCTEMLGSIENEGDALVLHNELIEAEKYYKQNLEDQSNYYKLANVQHLRGNLIDATQNAEKSLQKQLQNFNKEDREKCIKICSVHTKVAKIKLDKEDFITAESHNDEIIQLLPDQPTFERAKAFTDRGQVRFKKGDVVNAEKDFSKSQLILNELIEKTSSKGFGLRLDYFLTFITLLFRNKTKKELDEWYDQEMTQLSKSEEEISNIKAKIYNQHMKVNEALRKVANYVEDKNKYEVCVKKGRKYLLQLQQRQTNDPHEKAQLKVMEATIEGCLNLVESQNLLKEAIKLIESKQPFHENVGKYSQILAQLQQKSLEQSENIQESIKSGKKIHYDDHEHNQLYKKSKRNFDKAIRIMAYNKSKASHEVLSLKNKSAYLDFNECNFSECEKFIQEAKQSFQDKNHTELAKSNLLLARIAFSRGQLKSSFEKLAQTKEVLKAALVLKNEERYYKIYRCHDVYLDSKALRTRIYLQQMNHDLSLKDLNCISHFLNMKMQGDQYHPLLPQLLQLRAETISLDSSKRYEIDDYFEQAINLREHQHGKWNLANAATYCNFAKYLLLYQDYITAGEYIEKALEIYSCFDEDHPSTYKVLFTNAIYKIKKGNNEEGLKDMKKCLEMLEKRYDSSHMLLVKTKYHYANELCESGNIDDGIEQLLSVQNILHTNLFVSGQRSKIQTDLDDEKIRLKRLLYESLKKSYTVKNQIQKSQRCDIQLRTLRGSYEFRLWE